MARSNKDTRPGHCIRPAANKAGFESLLVFPASAWAAY